MGSLPELLCTVIETSQTPSGFVPSDPLKMTSSILPLLNMEYFCSPKTQRIASTMFVFPHPLGPTTVVMPCPSFMTSLLAKDLKPCIFNSDIYTKAGLDAVRKVNGHGHYMIEKYRI